MYSGRKSFVALPKVKLRHRYIGMIMAFSFLIAKSGICANVTPVPLLKIPPCHQAPVIDGIFSAGEWDEAFCGTGMVLAGSKGYIEPRQVNFWLTYDSSRLYFAFKSETPPTGRLLSRIRKEGGEVWIDDAVEVWLNPGFGEKAVKGRYYQFAANSIGGCFGQTFDPDIGQSFLGGYDKWNFNSRVKDGWWFFEGSVSIDALTDKKISGGTWGINLCRDWKGPSTFCSWSHTDSFSQTGRMAQVIFAEKSPVVQVLSLGNLSGGKAHVLLRISNTTAESLNLKASVALDAGKERNVRETFTLLPGQRKELLLKEDGFPRMETNRLAISVEDAEGENTYYAQTIPFGPEETRKKWESEDTSEKAVLLKTSFYPSLDRLKVSVDFLRYSVAEKVKKISIDVKPSGQKKILGSALLTEFKDCFGEQVLNLKPLAEGTYEVSASLYEDGNIPLQTVVSEFSKTRWEWEGNSLGKTNKILPPFTPLEVKGKVVSCWGRAYHMNGYGLWDKVVAQGTNILAGPVKMRSFSGGSEEKWEFLRSTFVKTEEHEVTITSQARTPAVDVTAESIIEYDGMMKIILRLSPGRKPVDRLFLEIPLKEEYATLMHACGDFIRSNYSGYVPLGKDRVWSSIQIGRTGLAGTFIPYIWVGDEMRGGICWMADWDKGWIVSDQVPAIEIVRKKGQVNLLVNLMSGPFPNQVEREIVFALQATPVKPQLQGWRKQFFGFYFPFPPAEQTKEWTKTWIDTGSRLWGNTPSSFGDVYPEDKNYAYVHQRKKEVLNLYSGYDKFGTYTNRVGLRSNLPELRYFWDEWTSKPVQMQTYSEREYDNCVGIYPSGSVIDFYCWYLDKLIREGGVDGIYIDNTYPVCSLDTVGEHAYVREDGQLQPNCALFAEREYIKRLAQIFYLNGKDSLIILHMTNSLVIPAFSFAQFQLDGEMNYSDTREKDSIYSFPLEFLRAESTGIQAGLVPFFLYGMRIPDPDGSLTRSHLSVTLLHGIKEWISPGYPNIQQWNDTYLALMRFGYAKSDSAFRPYWTNADVVSTSVPDVKVSFYERPGKILAIISNTGVDTTNVDVRFNLDKLKMTDAEPVCRDAVTGGEIAQLRSGKMSIEIPRHDFKLVVISSKK
ncbi:MAG: glycoside hydrolase domain-containing protein [Candidatus Omnitrophota bacterium]